LTPVLGIAAGMAVNMATVAAVCSPGGGGGPGGSATGGFLSVEGPPDSLVDRFNRHFTDNFADGLLDRWWTTWLGSFSESPGVLTVDTLEVSGNPRAAIAYNSIGFTDLTATATIGEAGNNHTVFARAALSGTFRGYMVQAVPGGIPLIKIRRVDAGVATLIATASGSLAAGDTLGIRCTGTTIEAIKNGAAVASAVDATYATGSVGLGAHIAAGLTYSTFTVDAA